ncbi:hypothetical protein AB0N05_27665 [Nocardia sp. NPDC051030]|uniref:hypothetical protein n=1 Tax=Nocardia sp. NPDC051030 TaxID=3155162 RepID=UPI0034338F2F
MTGPSLINLAVVRPYPQAIAGTPRQWHYDSATATFTLRYTARRADSGESFTPADRTEVYLPQSSYPSGYQVEVQGAHVISASAARLLQLTTDPGEDSVSTPPPPNSSMSSGSAVRSSVALARPEHDAVKQGGIYLRECNY